MSTLQDIINSVRVDLQDVDATRYTNSQLLGFANDGIQEAFRKRPDFRLGSYKSATTTYGLTDQVPIPVQYQSLLIFYITGRAEMRDDEYAVDGRAAQLLGLFAGEIKQ
jgi:hypothetical protein